MPSDKFHFSDLFEKHRLDLGICPAFGKSIGYDDLFYFAVKLRFKGFYVCKIQHSEGFKGSICHRINADMSDPVVNSTCFFIKLSFCGCQNVLAVFTVSARDLKRCAIFVLAEYIFSVMNPNA